MCKIPQRAAGEEGTQSSSLHLVEVITGRGASKTHRRLAVFLFSNFCTIDSPLPPLLGEKAGVCHRCLLQIALVAVREQRGTRIHFAGKQL